MMTILNDLLNLFFPRLCLVCTNPLVKGEEHICLHCLNDLPHIHFTDLENNPVAQLFLGKIPFISASAFLVYEKGGHVQKLIHALKYHDNKELGFYLGRLAALHYLSTEIFTNVDVLLPVPLHPRKQKQRGYNQSEWISKGISSITGIPVDTSTLLRSQKTESQTHKTIFERWENVQDIFILNKHIPLLPNRHILLIDDVITTGSTLCSCAEVLLKTPGTQISLFGIAAV